MAAGFFWPVASITSVCLALARPLASQIVSWKPSPAAKVSTSATKAPSRYTRAIPVRPARKPIQRTAVPSKVKVASEPGPKPTAAVGSGPGSLATFTFEGTAVRWIGFRAGRTGIARVYLDGAFIAEIDTFAASEGFQDTIWEASGLASARHTLVIEATGQKNPAATNNYVVVDAFDVRR